MHGTCFEVLLGCLNQGRIDGQNMYQAWKKLDTNCVI